MRKVSIKEVKTKLVIFGVTGDLAGRKLLPALDSIIRTEEHANLSIIGISRQHVDRAELLKHHPLLMDRTDIFTMDLATVGEYSRLKQFLEADPADQTLFYLSVPPNAAAGIVDFLGEAGLTTPRYKILFEKPFGFDITSAKEFIARTSRYFNEEQIYRIDHYMAKEIAAELLKLRRNAETHQYHWSNESVKAITVVATETIGIEGRVQFYEQTGALRDFVQGHLMQLLSLVLIRNPTSGNLASQRLAALEQIREVEPGQAVRAQYEGYSKEVSNEGSRTETFVALKLESDDPHWRGVALRLVTGKALDEKRSYIHIEYKDGYEDRLDESRLLRRGGMHLDAYERVLIEAIEGRKDIFTSSSEVIRSWEILAPVQQSWSMDAAPISIYPRGMNVTALLY